MIGSRRSGLERDTCGLGRWIGEVPVDRIADYQGAGREGERWWDKEERVTIARQEPVRRRKGTR